MAIKRKRKMAYKRASVAIEHTGFYAYLLRYNEAISLPNIIENCHAYRVTLLTVY